MNVLPRVLALLALPVSVVASDFLQEYEPVKASGDAAATEKFLAGAYDANKGNPEYFVAAANYWWGRATAINISTKPPAAGEISVNDQKTGKSVGSISTEGEVNPELGRKAMALLREATGQFPTRADIAIGLAYIQHQSHLEDDCLRTLEAFLDRAADPSVRLLWKADGRFPEPPEQFIPESLEEYEGDFLHEQSKEGNARCRALCEHLVRVFPNHPYPYNMLGALSHQENDEAACLKYLKLAFEKDPKDALVLMNLGDAQLRAGQKKEAKASYEKALKLGDEGLKADARKALKRIK